MATGFVSPAVEGQAVGLSSGMVARALTVIGCALLVAVFVIWMALGIGGPKVTTGVDDIGEAVAAFLGAAGCLFAAIRRRHDRIAWSLLAAACFSWGAGETVWSYYELFRGISVPFPSYADIGFVGEALLAIPAIVLFKTARVAGLSRTKMLLDATAIAGVLASVSLMTVLGQPQSGNTFSRALAQFYPTADIVVFTLGVLLIIRAPLTAKLTYSLIAMGVLLVAVSDSLFAYFTNLGTYAMATHVTSTGWFAGFLLLGLAGLSDKGMHGPARLKLPGYFEMVLPYLCIIGAFLVISVEGFQRNPPSVMARLAIGVALVRLLLTSMQNRSQIRVLDAQLSIIERHLAATPELELSSRRNSEIRR